MVQAQVVGRSRGSWWPGWPHPSIWNIFRVGRIERADRGLLQSRSAGLQTWFAGKPGRSLVVVAALALAAALVPARAHERATNLRAVVAQSAGLVGLREECSGRRVSSH